MAINMAATACQRQQYYKDGHRPLEIPNHSDEVDDARCYGSSRWRNVEKRKSAVELLRETRPLYIRSETIADGEQESRTDTNPTTPPLQLPLILPSPPPPPSSPLLSSYLRKTKFEFQCAAADANSASVSVVDQPANGVTNCACNAANAGVPREGNEAIRGCVDQSNDGGRDHDPHSLSHRPSTIGISSDRCEDVPFAVLRNTRLIQPPPAFRKSGSSSRLQNKLRKLLVSESMEEASDGEVDADKDSVATHKTTPNDERRKNAAESNNSHALSNNEKNMGSGVNSLLGKSLPDLTSVAVRPKYARPIPYSTSSDSDAREKWPHYQDVCWVSCETQPLSPSVKEDRSSNKKENERDSGSQNYSGNSLLSSPAGSGFSYITPPPLYCDDAGQLESLRRRLLVARSKSDVGDARSSKSDVGFGVEATTNVVPLIDSPNLNLFFDNLGFDSDEFSSIMATRSNSSSPVYLECDGDSSSVESVGGRGSDDENTPKDQSSAAAKSLSIVERNARIIKWLCNCRKAFEPLRRFTPLSQSR